MSYILDALRKAEHERNLGDTPRLTFSPLSETGRRRPLLMWGLVALLGISVGVLGAMQISQMRSAVTTTEIVAEPAPPVAPPPARVVAPKVVVVKPAVENNTPPKSTTRQVQVNTPKGPVAVDMPLMPETRTMPKSEPGPPPQRQAVAQEEVPPDVVREQPVSRTGTRPASVTENPEPESQPMLMLPSAAELAAEFEYGQNTTPAEALSEEAPPEQVAEPEVAEQIMSYHGLPAATRSSIGDLTMSAHVYSSTRGRGFVMINGSRYRTGDRLAEGPVLEDIRQEGAILSYRGQRFLLPVPR